MTNNLDTELFEFLESYKKQPLTNKEKKYAMRLYNKFDRDDKNIQKASNSAAKNTIKKNIFLKYGATAITSIIVCLCIALPITISILDKHPTNVVIPNEGDSHKTRYSSDYILNSNYENIKNLGFLLFSNKEHEEQIFDTETVFVEYTTQKVGLALSYVVEGATVFIQDETVTDTFTVDYRVRTYNEYDFTTYYTDFYATIENLYNEKATTVIDENELYEFDTFEIIESQEIKSTNTEFVINAFIVNDLPIFCLAQPSGVVIIYFVYGNNEYMITVTKDINTPEEFQVTPTAQYIKDHFLPALFKNL